jgi:hypothetical protein
VVPRTQGFRDTVRHEVDGFLFNPADVSDATRYMQRLKDDEALRRRMGAEGCAAVNSRGVDFVVADLLRWYERGWDTSLRRKGQLFYRVVAPAMLLAFVPFTVAIFCLYNFTVSARGPASVRLLRLLTGVYVLSFPLFHHITCVAGTASTCCRWRRSSPSFPSASTPWPTPSC